MYCIYYIHVFTNIYIYTDSSRNYGGIDMSDPVITALLNVCDDSSSEVIAHGHELEKENKQKFANVQPTLIDAMKKIHEQNKLNRGKRTREHRQIT